MSRDVQEQCAYSRLMLISCRLVWDYCIVPQGEIICLHTTCLVQTAFLIIRMALHVCIMSFKHHKILWTEQSDEKPIWYDQYIIKGHGKQWSWIDCENFFLFYKHATYTSWVVPLLLLYMYFIMDNLCILYKLTELPQPRFW